MQAFFFRSDVPSADQRAVRRRQRRFVVQVDEVDTESVPVPRLELGHVVDKDVEKGPRVDAHVRRNVRSSQDQGRVELCRMVLVDVDRWQVLQKTKKERERIRQLMISKANFDTS